MHSQHNQRGSSSDFGSQSQSRNTEINREQAFPGAAYSDRVYQSSNIQFKSLGSIEEESPRWTNPPQPVSNPGRELETVPSGEELMLLGASGSNGQSSNSQFGATRGTAIQYFSRHVQSQPALPDQSQRRGAWAAPSSEDFNESQQQQHHAPHTQNIGGIGSLGHVGSIGGIIHQTGDSRDNVGFSSPAYRIPESYQLQMFSEERDLSKAHRKAMLLQTFVDRLHTREKVSTIQAELKDIEQMVFVQLQKDQPDLYQSLLRQQAQKLINRDASANKKTHYAVIESTLAQAQSLRETFEQYHLHRNDVQSFNQLVDGIQMDAEDGLRGSQTFHARNAHGSIDSLPDKVNKGVFAGSIEIESTINHIKSGSIPSDEQKTGSSKESQQENFMVQIMRQQEQEISKQHELVEKLKSQGADLELTIVDQRQEIQNLCNRLKQSQLSQQQESTDTGKDQHQHQLSFDRREMDNLVKRLKDDLRSSQEEGLQARKHLKETGEVIMNLQGQVNTLKHRLVLSNDASKSQFGQEFQLQLKEMADLRTQNEKIMDKYQQMAEQVSTKEQELDEMEEKSKQMLIAAQQDAHECIKYFKGLALQASFQDSKKHQAARSHSPMQNRVQKPVNNPMLKELTKQQNQMPWSLAPVLNQKRPNKNKAFESNSRNQGEYNVNGVKLRMNKRATSTLETQREHSANGRESLSLRQQRAQTLSPISGGRAPKVQVDVAPRTITVQNRHNSLKRDDSTLSDRSRGHNQQLSTLPDLDCNNPQVVVKVWQAETKLEFALNSLTEAFSEIALTKKGIAGIVQSYGEQYCTQLQKFSVLTYDYLERIDNLVKREAEFKIELEKQSGVVNQLKMITVQQTEHIAAQNALIMEQKNQMALRAIGYERVHDKSSKDLNKVGQIITDQFPLLRDTIVASQVAILDRKKETEFDKHDLSKTNHLHDLSKKKVNILEEELEKSLQTSQMLEDSVQGTRKKFNQLVDLIKDIWQEEVQSQSINPVMSSIPTQPTQQRNGNHGSTSHRKPDAQSDLTQTIHSTGVTEVPMPISWLSDISDHIKTLKEMNDFQTDEVFQIVNMLTQDRKQEEGDENEGWTANADSNSSIEQEDKSMATPYQDQQQTLAEDQMAFLEEQQEECVEQSETERNLQQYDDASRIHDKPMESLPDIGDADDLYIHTTEVSKSRSRQHQGANKQFNSLLQDEKEMSFSQRLDGNPLQQQRQPAYQNHDGQFEQRPGRPSSQNATGRNGGWVTYKEQDSRKRDRSHPSRNYDWPDGGLLANRAVETQRVDQKRQSFNITGNRWKEGLCSDNNAGKSGRNPQLINSPFAQQITQTATGLQGYRTSIDMTATQGTVAVDCSKRNELYSMLREEVLGFSKQMEIRKETVLAMKRQLKNKKKEIVDAEQSCRALNDEKEGQIEVNRNLEDELKELEFQNDELKGVVQDREASMENLKMQIEDFERELMGLQDQMTHVMKLNSEIGLASEHWENSYHSLQEQKGQEVSKLREDFNKKMGKKVEKIQQFKRKLQEKENVLKNLQEELIAATSYREEQESQRLNRKDIGVVTEPAMELLEQHKQVLEKRLGSVKHDITSVLDQVEKEQIEKAKVQQKLSKQKETSKSLIGELNQTQQTLSKVDQENQGLKQQLDANHEELRQMSEAMELDQEQYRQQMAQAEKINSELQLQVEQVTRAAEELQEHYQTNDGLTHNVEILEQKINQLEDQLMYYKGQLEQKNHKIHNLELRVSGQRRQSKREVRSVSVPRITSQQMSSQQVSKTGNFINQEVNQSQMLPAGIDNRLRNHQSISNNSSFLITGGGHKIEQDDKDQVYHVVDELNNSLKTSQSIFDDQPILNDHEDSATFSRAPDATNDNERLKTQCDARESNSFFISSQRHLSKKLKPPLTTNCNTKASLKEIRGAENSIRGHKNRDRTSFQQEANSDGLEISPFKNNLGKTQTGISTIMGQSQNATCCCGATNCNNNSTQFVIARKQSDLGRNQNESSKGRLSEKSKAGKQTAIDDLQSSYKNFKAKQETSKETKRKMKRALKMTETLVRYFLNEAQLKVELRNEKHRRMNSSEMGGGYSTLNELQKHMTNWSAQYSAQNIIVTEEEAQEAQAYFSKRNQKVIDCLKSLVDQVSSEQAQENEIKKSFDSKSPPQIMSHRGAQQFGADDQLETEMSENNEQTRKFSELDPNNFGSLQPDLKNPLNLVIEEYAAGQPISPGNSRNSKGAGMQQLSGMNGLLSMKSPTSSCRNCTATFHQTQSVANDLMSHCKLLFQKFLQTSRSLAGICYGGSIFMGDSMKNRDKRNIDYALNFLAKDSSEFEAQQNGQSLEELWSVVDGLLASLSLIISGSCQNLMRANNQLMDTKRQNEAFESIAQKSIELSMDQNHMISRMERASFEIDSASRTPEPTISQQPVNSNHVSSVATAQVSGRLIDLESRIKHKFGNIKSLESLIDTILGKSKDQAPLLPSLIKDASGLQKVFLNIRRAVSKLKIELHQDYLHLGQVNLHFQTQSSRDHNGSMTTTFEMPNQTQTFQSAGQQQQYQQTTLPANAHFSIKRDSSAIASNSGSVTLSGYSSMPQMQMQIGSQGGAPITAREQPSQNGLTSIQTTSHHHPTLSNQAPIHIQQQKQLSNGLNIQQQMSQRYPSSSTIHQGSNHVVKSPGQHFQMNSARFSNNTSGATSTARGFNVTKNSQIDRIVEELQGLTFEHHQHNNI